MAFLGAGGNPSVDLQVLEPASNGAPPFNRGNRVRAYRGGACGTASIGPRSFDRGNVSILTTVLLVDSCSHPIVYSSELSLQGLKSILAELEAQWQRIQRIHTHT